MPAGERIQGEPGYVLHHRSFGETSLLLEVFTPTVGRLGVIAKGARAAKSRLRGLLQIGQPLLLSWRDAGELATLHAAEASAAAHQLEGEALFCAWYLNELILRLSPRRLPQPQLFIAYAAALGQLGLAARPTLRLFECQMLEELGEALLLPADLDAGQLYHYDWEAGPIPGPIDASFSGPSCPGSGLIALRERDLAAAAALEQARPLLRAAIARQLGGQALKTPKLLQALRSLQPGSV